MKLAVVGGGGFRVPLIYQALLRESSPLVDEIMLYDVDGRRLEVIGAVLTGLAERAAPAAPPRVTSTTDLDRALRDADFVFSATRVDGLTGRVADEQAARSQGLVAQETTGPGGVLYGLRTVPVAVRLAERIATLAPSAWAINFTNPVGMVTSAMSEVLGERVIGICDSPRALCRRVARAVGAAPDQAHYDYVGLNHLGWLRAVLVDGRDLLPGLLASDATLASIEEGRLFGPERLRSLGAVPNEYLWYWYERVTAESLGQRGPSRAEFLLDQQNRFYAAAATDRPAGALRLWRDAVAERDASYLAAERAVAGAGERDPLDEGYERVALDVMRAIARDEQSVHIVSRPNRVRREHQPGSSEGDKSRGLPAAVISDLPSAAVVEVPCVIDAAGAHPLEVLPVNDHMLQLMQTVAAVEVATVRAALAGSPELAEQALAMHPMVGSLDVAHRVLEARGVSGRR